MGAYGVGDGALLHDALHRATHRGEMAERFKAWHLKCYEGFITFPWVRIPLSPFYFFLRVKVKVHKK
jgi:hypothetical protein